ARHLSTSRAATAGNDAPSGAYGLRGAVWFKSSARLRNLSGGIIARAFAPTPSCQRLQRLQRQFGRLGQASVDSFTLSTFSSIFCTVRCSSLSISRSSPPRSSLLCARSSSASTTLFPPCALRSIHPTPPPQHP